MQHPNTQGAEAAEQCYQVSSNDIKYQVALEVTFHLRHCKIDSLHYIALHYIQWAALQLKNWWNATTKHEQSYYRGIGIQGLAVYSEYCKLVSAVADGLRNATPNQLAG